MKIKIAIVEMETHSFLLEQWYSLLQEMQFEFHFFVHPKVFKNISIIPDEYITISINIPNLDDYDVIIINTYHRYFEKFNKIFEKKNVLVISHNINFSLNFSWPRFFRFFESKQTLLYLTKLYFKEAIFKTRKSILKANKIGVLSPQLLNSCLNKSIQKKTMFINLNFTEKKYFKINSGFFHVVITGNVSHKRKDLDLIFSVLKDLRPLQKIKFTFLGKVNDGSIKKELEICKKVVSPFVEIVYYEKFLMTENFKAIINSADFLFCPVVKTTSFYAVEEKYGITKVTGNEGDCIRFGKIGIFPSYYPDFGWYTINYNSKVELVSFFNTLNEEKVKTEYIKLEPYFEKYSKKNVKYKLEQILLSFINNARYTIT